MLHSPEDTLDAYRKVADLTMDVVRNKIDKIKIEADKCEDSFEFVRLKKEIEELEDCLYIIGNDD